MKLESFNYTPEKDFTAFLLGSICRILCIQNFKVFYPRTRTLSFLKSLGGHSVCLMKSELTVIWIIMI